MSTNARNMSTNSRNMSTNSELVDMFRKLVDICRLLVDIFRNMLCITWNSEEGNAIRVVVEGTLPANDTGTLYHCLQYNKTAYSELERGIKALLTLQLRWRMWWTALVVQMHCAVNPRWAVCVWIAIFMTEISRISQHVFASRKNTYSHNTLRNKARYGQIPVSPGLHKRHGACLRW